MKIGLHPTRVLIALGLSTLATTAALARSSRAAHPDFVRVRSLQFAGSGCPAGSVAGLVSPDVDFFSLSFDNYVAEIGPGIAFSQKRKNCQLALDFEVPQGWSFSLIDVEYRGYVALEAGVKAKQKSSYYFQGQLAQASLQTTIYGPAYEDYDIRDVLGVSALVWSPCGFRRALNINSQVLLDSSNPYARGLIALSDIDGAVVHRFGLAWRRCSN